MSDSSVVSRFLRIVFFLVLIVFAWREGWPRLQNQISGSRNTCLPQVQKMTDRFARQMNAFDNRRADLEAWDELRLEMEAEARVAKELCSCDRPSCRKARAATSELSKLVHSFHLFLQGGSSVVHPEARIAHIDDLLREARSLAKQGR